MPRKKSGKSKSSRTFGDVTLNDYANALVPNNRLKKSSNNVMIALEEVEKCWDEKDLEEFDGDRVPITNDDGTVSYIIRKVERLERKTPTSKDNKNDDTDGVTFPIDIWFKIAEFIRPEDVGRFAAICKASYEVTCSSQFWFGLYRRFYKHTADVPNYLQPKYMVRKYALRANVIKALYYTHKPFVDRIQQKKKVSEHPKSLINTDCTLLYYTCNCFLHIYYFKMRRKVVMKRYDSDILEFLDDININPDDDCRTMIIKSPSDLHALPPVLGLTLKSAVLTSSNVSLYGTCHMEYKLHLSFIGDSCEVQTTFDPVVSLRIWDWWHPPFPHDHSMAKIPSQNLRSTNHFNLSKYNFVE